jgi:hypothetical protein
MTWRLLMNLLGDHKNYRFCAYHWAQVMIKPAFSICINMNKLVFVSALISCLTKVTRCMTNE